MTGVQVLGFFVAFFWKVNTTKGVWSRGCFFPSHNSFYCLSHLTFYTCITCLPDTPSMIACCGGRLRFLAAQYCWSLQKVQMLNVADYLAAPGIRKFWNCSSIHQETAFLNPGKGSCVSFLALFFVLGPCMWNYMH